MQKYPKEFNTPGDLKVRYDFIRKDIVMRLYYQIEESVTVALQFIRYKMGVEDFLRTSFIEDRLPRCHA
ncbi:hypothetical protein TNCV_1065491 [Trichonephila clavipes]|nr:hypothetical protein TNCV_1065491 [Trichonephila clavipes]